MIKPRKEYTMKKYILALLFVFLVGGVCFAESEDNFIMISPHVYATDLATESLYIPGGSYLGASLTSYLSLNPGPFTIDLGVYGSHDFGDEKFLTDAKPIITVTYGLQDTFLFRIGVLDNANNYDLLDAFKYKIDEFRREIDYGAQIKLGSEGPKYRLDMHSWVVWALLDTPEHRENLDWGTTASLHLPHFIFSGQMYWTHHGGEWYYAGDLIDYWNYAGGIENYYDLNNKILKRVGVKAYYMSNEFHNYDAHISTYGKGVLGEVYAQLGLIRVHADMYHEISQLNTEEGNPIYKHDDFLTVGYQVRAEVIEGFYFKSWANVQYFLDIQKFGLETMVGFELDYEIPVSIKRRKNT